MSDVAEAAGVGKGTLYRHFASKADLCHMLIDSDQRNLQDRTLARLREQGDPLTDLAWFLREVIAFVIRNQALIFAEEILGAVIDHPAHVWWRQTTRGLLARINPECDVDYIADVLFVMIDPRAIHYQLTSRGYSEERIADALIAVMRRLTE
jgi:AcrR family transcriptional regulator